MLGLCVFLSNSRSLKYLFTKLPISSFRWLLQSMCLITVITSIEVLLLSAHLHLHWFVFNINVSAACSDRWCDFFFPLPICRPALSFISFWLVLFRKLMLYQPHHSIPPTCKVSWTKKSIIPRTIVLLLYSWVFFYPLKTVLIALWLYFSYRFSLIEIHFYVLKNGSHDGIKEKKMLTLIKLFMLQ